MLGDLVRVCLYVLTINHKGYLLFNMVLLDLVLPLRNTDPNNSLFISRPQFMAYET